MGKASLLAFSGLVWSRLCPDSFKSHLKRRAQNYQDAPKSKARPRSRALPTPTRVAINARFLRRYRTHESRHKVTKKTVGDRRYTEALLHYKLNLSLALRPACDSPIASSTVCGCGVPGHRPHIAEQRPTPVADHIDSPEMDQAVAHA